MSSPTVRVVCEKCGSKLDIRAELAGSKRRCPKCKTEFVVPSPAAEEDDGVSLVEDDDSPAEVAPKSPARKPASEAPLIQPAAKSAPASSFLSNADDQDDDDDDYVPSFVTATAKADSKTPLPQVAAKPAEVDDEPVLSIPKVPAPTKPKYKPFDPAEFEDKEEDPPPRSTRKTTPVPTSRDRDSGGRRNRMSDEFELDEPSPPPKSRVAASRSPGLSDSSIPTPSPTRDRAAAARELRQALKDSSLRAPPEQESRGGFSFDFSGLWSEIGLKGLGIIAGIVIMGPLLFIASNSMMGGGPKLPPLGYVTGKVTYNGQPAANAQVNFMPIPEQGNESEAQKYSKIRTSLGMTNDKGEFQLIYMEGVPGVAVGKCRVWLELPPPMITPQEFTIATVTVREVKSGRQTFDFAVDGPQPKIRK